MTQLNWRIVDRYFAGEATAAERAVVERWLADSPLFRVLVAELYRGALDHDATRRAADDVRIHFERALALHPKPIPSHIEPAGSRAVPMRRAGMLRAAAVIVLLGGPFMIWRMVRIANAPYTAATLQTITAPAGRRVTVSLPDGSHAMLSPGSTLRYVDATFNTTAGREVRLEGEAYFDVDHDPRRPFVVRAGDLVAQDLGTQFVVRAYPEDRHGQVVVRQGLVGIGGDVVNPGQLGRLTEHGRPMVEPADTASWFAWTQGQLRFANMPLREALPKLRRWYDLEFRLAERELEDIELVGDFPEQLGNGTLQELATALGLRVTRAGRVVTFHSNGPSVPPHAR